MKLRNKLFVPLLSLLTILIYLVPSTLNAQGFVPLVSLPGLENPNGLGFNEYLNALLRIAIIAGALIAVVKLILAGVQYVLSGIVTEKADAKKDIISAIVGLLIIILAVTILRTINPDLVNLGMLPDAPSFDAQTIRAEPVSGEDAQFIAFKKFCQESPADCTAESCSEMAGLGISQLNRIYCNAECSIRNGFIVNRQNIIGGTVTIDSGSCIYPNDEGSSLPRRQQFISDTIEERLEDTDVLQDNELVYICSEQSGTPCMESKLDCEIGIILPDEQIGTPREVVTKDGYKAIICSPE